MTAIYRDIPPKPQPPSALRRLRDLIAPPEKQPDAHFLHIGKNAGNQINHVIRQINRSGQLRIQKQGHDVSLRKLPHDAKYFFAIRDPIDRFRSGFYSRKRKGRPKNNYEWNWHEALAFEAFDDANDLAEALFSTTDQGRAATAAMKSIGHVETEQIDWFARLGNFLTLRPPIWIVRVEQFDFDLDLLVRRLGYAGEFELTRDPIKGHVNDYADVPPLSDRAIDNLNRWYAQDVAFYDMCAAWLDGGASHNPSQLRSEWQ